MKETVVYPGEAQPQTTDLKEECQAQGYVWEPPWSRAFLEKLEVSNIVKNPTTSILP
jgi:hypothetical protein